MSAAHARANECLCIALATNNYDAWVSVSDAWATQLSERRRAALAWAAMRSLTLGHGKLVADAVYPDASQVIKCSRCKAELHPDELPNERGECERCRILPLMPIAPLISDMEQAAFWADMASAGTLDAYCLACFRKMAPERQAAFRSHIEGLHHGT